MTTLTAPAGGEWVRVSSTTARPTIRCAICGSLAASGWRYYIGSVSHASVCDDCAPTTEEAPMTGTAGITPEVLVEVQLALEAAVLDWEEGRAASPDTRDYVLITEQVLTRTVGPEYLWLADGVTREQVADLLYEAQCDGRIDVYAEMAEWLVTAVTVGPEAAA